MAFKVVQLVEVPGMPDYQEGFEQSGLEIEVVKNIVPLTGVTEDQVIQAGKEGDAVITLTTLQPFSRQVIESLPRCKFIMSVGIGYDLLDVAAATDHGILVANVPDASVEEMSDHTMALILACTRRMVQLDTAVRAGDWKSTPANNLYQTIGIKMSRLRGQTLGLLGFGRIPRTLAPKAKGFGVKLIAYDPYADSKVFEELGVERVNFDTLLEQSDILSVHAALTPETRHLIGLTELKKMKSTAHLVNTARGSIVDPQALYAALKEGEISGAAVDVTEPDPISLDDPLLTLNNFVVTPHIGVFSPLSIAETFRRPLEEISRVYKGEWPNGLVNREVKEKYLKKWGK